MDAIWQREILVKLPIQALVAEGSFYLVHVFLSTSLNVVSLQSHTIHKVHHRFIAPTAMACVYAHPIEFAIGNILPIYIGCMLTNAHPKLCYYIWFPMAMAGTCKGHVAIVYLDLPIHTMIIICTFVTTLVVWHCWTTYSVRSNPTIQSTQMSNDKLKPIVQSQ